MILEQFALHGRVALVTGAGRGLGRAGAVALAQAGADVALVGRSPSTRTREMVESLGRRTATVTCDLGSATAEDLGTVVDEVTAALGRLDILLNNAGTIHRAAAARVTPADWEEVLQVNLSAAFFLCQAAGRVMLEQGSGKIINVASMLSFQGGVRVPAYTASKHALAGLTRALANEWAPSGVNVNAIAPGYMCTDNTAALRADEARAAAILERIPAGRWGQPEDLMGAVVFLASPAADYLHGTILAVDGGWLAR